MKLDRHVMHISQNRLKKCEKAHCLSTIVNLNLSRKKALIMEKMCSLNFRILERALRALASSSGGAACPGGTRGQPQGSTPGVRGWFQGDWSEKKKICDGRTDERTNGRTDTWTDRRVGWNSDLDVSNLFYRLTTIHLEDCPKPVPLFL